MSHTGETKAGGENEGEDTIIRNILVTHAWYNWDIGMNNDVADLLC